MGGGRTVWVNDRPVAVVGDPCKCTGSQEPNKISSGASSILVGDVPIAVEGSETEHGGKVTGCSPDVFVGDGAAAACLTPAGRGGDTVAAIVHGRDANEKMLQAAPLASLCRHVYAPTGPANPLPEGFKLVEPARKEDRTTGFLGATYENQRGEVFVAFAGTDFDRPGTLLADAGLWAGGKPKAFSQAVDYYRDAVAESRKARHVRRALPRRFVGRICWHARADLRDCLQFARLER